MDTKGTMEVPDRKAHLHHEQNRFSVKKINKAKIITYGFIKIGPKKLQSFSFHKIFHFEKSKMKLGINLYESA